MIEFVQVSTISAHCEEVWDRAVTPDGINYELFPFMRMTVPKVLQGKSIHEVAIGTSIGRSWFLLFGFLPFDYDDITVAELQHGHRFREKSSMFSIEDWEHERTVTANGDNCDVCDRVRFVLRHRSFMMPLFGNCTAIMLRALFAHRHRRLAKWFNNQKVQRPRQ